MTGIAEDQLRSFVDRILRLKEEQDALAADIRDIYTEAKSSGFDKTVMGRLVTYLRKRAKDSGAVEEQDAIFDLYLTSYDNAASAKPSRTRMRMPAREKEPLPAHDPETGELLEDRASASEADAVTAIVPPAADDGGTPIAEIGASEADGASAPAEPAADKGSATPPFGETNEGEDDARNGSAARAAPVFQNPDLIDDRRRPAPERGGDVTPPRAEGQANDGRDTLAPMEKTSGVTARRDEHPLPPNVRPLAPHLAHSAVTNAPAGEDIPAWMRRQA